MLENAKSAVALQRLTALHEKMIIPERMTDFVEPQEYQSVLREAALILAEAGFHLFPLRRGTKQPLTNPLGVERGKGGLHLATAAPDGIAGYWAVSPHAGKAGWDSVPLCANIGINCGKSNLIVLDVDVKNNAQGKESLERLLRQNGDLNTFTVRTPSGGWHFYFWQPQGFEIGNAKLDAKGFPGIETRGTGGYVVAPYSQIQGKFYEIESCQPIADCPKWLMDFLAPQNVSAPVALKARSSLPEMIPQKKAEELLRKITQEVAQAQLGNRNTTLNKAAFTLGGILPTGCLDEIAIITQLEAASTVNGHVIDDGLDAVRATIRSGLASGRNLPWQQPLSRSVPGASAGSELQVIYQDPAPVQTILPPAPPFPVETLPKLFAQLVTEEAARRNVPVDAIAIPGLANMAGIIGNRARLHLKADRSWPARACFFGMVIMPKASGKSGAADFAFGPLRALAAALQSKAPLKKPINAVLKGKETEDEETNICLLVNDATIEKLADLMQCSPGITFYRDELAGFMQNLTRYSKGSDRPFFLQAHSGGLYRVERVGRKNNIISDLYLNIFGAIQPKVAKDIFATDHFDDGFLERFQLMAYPEPIRHAAYLDSPQKGSHKLYTAYCVEMGLADFGVILFADDEDSKPYCLFSPEAQELFKEWLVAHHDGIAQLDEDDPMRGFLGKASYIFGSLCLCLHLTRYFCGEHDDPRYVSARIVRDVVRLVNDYFIPMWKRILVAFSSPIKASHLERIARHILDRKPPHIRPSDISSLGWSGLGTAKDVEPVLHRLAELGWLIAPTNTGARSAGRPSATYVVNPRVFTMDGPIRD
jgi:Protein of unknown function (DUF3987)/Bifunctional DNA primase/polymerase, N-terminal